MRRVVATSLAVACLSVCLGGAAFAADLGAAPAPVYTKAPIVAPFSWTGFYLGAHAGWGSSGEAWFEDSTQTGGLGPVGFQDANYTANGFLGGGQIGFNYQLGWFVFGAEGDFSGADITGTGGGCFPETGVVQSCSTKMNWVSTATGRFGVALDQTLLYAKGGAAWDGGSHTNECSICFGGPLAWTSSDDRSGWTVGAGIEQALPGAWSHWSAKLEYDYIDFGTQDVGPFTNPPAFAPYTENIREQLQVIKAGINYRFY
jgi:outer membrane immunogenic protein